VGTPTRDDVMMAGRKSISDTILVRFKVLLYSFY
jgi:hypothetical protein